MVSEVTVRKNSKKKHHLLRWKSKYPETPIYDSGRLLQEAVTRGVLQIKCSKKFHNIHRKTPALGSLFNKKSFFIKKVSNTGAFQ